jgi:type II secretory pathway pseudopilin PulG
MKLSAGTAPRCDGGCRLPSPRGAFALVELLVVVAIIALLVALLLPSLQLARMQARVVRVHGDLRQICNALDAYSMDNHDGLPPPRVGCETNVNYQLPVELAVEYYFPRSPSRVPQAHFLDLFDLERTYKYRAPGAIYYNGDPYDFPDPDDWRPRAKIWVPNDFPRCEDPEGRYYENRLGEAPCPVLYAVWSIGPDPESRRFPRFEGFDEIDESKFPLPKRLWLLRAGDTGLITHFKSRQGTVYSSP